MRWHAQLLVETFQHCSRDAEIACIDNLKLYGTNSFQLRRLLEIVSQFSDSIRMSFGVEKCVPLEVLRGKVQVSSFETTLTNPTVIPSLGEHYSYKYLGIKQA